MTILKSGSPIIHCFYDYDRYIGHSIGIHYPSIVLRPKEYIRLFYRRRIVPNCNYFIFKVFL